MSDLTVAAVLFAASAAVLEAAAVEPSHISGTVVLGGFCDDPDAGFGAYPMGFYAKGLDGRIDDPKAGWKGRGLWTTSGDRTPWLREGGKGSLPIAVQFQYRPDPLAR